jgi:hypothetical protein
MHVLPCEAEQRESRQRVSADAAHMQAHVVLQLLLYSTSRALARCIACSDAKAATANTANWFVVFAGTLLGVVFKWVTLVCLLRSQLSDYAAVLVDQMQTAHLHWPALYLQLPAQTAR